MESHQLISEESVASQRRKYGLPAAIAAALVLVFAAGYLVGGQGKTDVTTSEVKQSTGLVQIVAQKARPLCTDSWKKVQKGLLSVQEGNCMQTKCCKVSGQRCFQKTAGIAGCLEKCNPDHHDDKWDCTMPHDIVPLVEATKQPSTELYCFSVYTADTGSTKKNHELELLQKQFGMKASIFSCAYHDVFSDDLAEVGPGYSTIQVQDLANDFHKVKRRERGTWVNTGLFKAVWRAVGAKQTWEQADWVVKVDADAVFVPRRLVNLLSNQLVSYSGVYMENCKEVDYGYFGSLEVMSHKAFEILLNSIDWCENNIDWAKEDATKWGPIGEDLFAQKCMDFKGVSKISNWDITTDGVCPGTRKEAKQEHNKKWKPDCSVTRTPSMHPFKKPDEWVSCYRATSALDSSTA